MMKTALAASFLIALSGAAAADGHGYRYHSGAAVAAPVAITVSCARYSLKGVIWDRPMPVFLDSLMAAGYTPERADAIGNRVCRDEAGVGNTAHTGATMQRILRTDPPRR